MKRIVALSLVFAVMGTAAVSAFAQTDNGQSAAVSVTADTDVVSYLEYIEKYEETAGQDITLLGTVATVERGGELLLPVTVPVSSWYNLEITYRATENDTGEISFSVLLDGKLPFAEADRFSLPRRYIDGGEIRKDGLGNEFTPLQKEVFDAQTRRLSCYSTFSTEESRFYLDAGQHIVALSGLGAEIVVEGVRLVGITMP